MKCRMHKHIDYLYRRDKSSNPRAQQSRNQNTKNMGSKKHMHSTVRLLASNPSHSERQKLTYACANTDVCVTDVYIGSRRTCTSVQTYTFLNADSRGSLANLRYQKIFRFFTFIEKCGMTQNLLLT